MTTTTPETRKSDTTPDYTEETLRERFDSVVVSTNPKSNKKAHLPDGDEPMCDSHLHRGKWIEKPVEVFPPGWQEWCERCLDRLREEDNEPEIVDADEVDW
jgi:hypothetical protein